MTKLGSLALAVMMAALAACSGDGAGSGPTSTTVASATTSDSSSGAGPKGFDPVVTASWQEVQPLLDGIPEGLADRIAGLGVEGGEFTLFVAGGSPDGRLEAGVEFGVSGGLVFSNEVSAAAAVDEMEGIAVEYVEAAGATAHALEAGPAGAVGVAATDPVFRGEVAAVAWVEGDAVRIAFAQGGDAGARVAEMMGTMPGGSP